MLRTVVAGLRARPLRLLLSAFATALGVAFVAGAFVLSDAVGAGLREAAAVQYRNVDASITSARGGPALDDELLARVRAVPGVAAAEGRGAVGAPLRDTSGRVVDAAAEALAADERLRAFDLVAGRVPGDAGEIALERRAAAGRALGQPVTVFDHGGAERAFTLVGTFSRPEDPGIGSARLVLLPEAVRLLSPRAPHGAIAVRAEPGVGRARLVADLDRAVGGRGVTVETGEQATARLVAGTPADGAGLTGFFTAFAVLAVVVAAMVIANSFTILVAQRAGELALLRCVGAGRRQVFAGVLAEAAAVGAVASAVGLAGGIGVAAAAQAIAGGPEAAVHLPLTARTVVVAPAVGVLVTALAAVLPAWAATRVAPVEALRAPSAGGSARAGRSRAVVASAAAVAAVGVAVLALRAEPGDGAALAVVAVLLLLGAAVAAGPLVAGPAVRALGALCSPLLGPPARLAALNAARDPRRTAAGAAALTIGFAVVSLVTSVAAGVEAGRGRGVDQQVVAEFAVTSVIPTRPLPDALGDALAAVPGVAVVVPRRAFPADLGPHGAYGLAAVRGDALGSVLRPAVLSGRLDRLGPGELAVHRQLAEETGLAVGDTVPAGPAANPVPLRVVAVYDSVDATGADLALGLVDLAQLPSLSLQGDRGHDDSHLVRLAEGADPEEVRPALERALAGAPLARLHGVADLRAEAAAPLRGTLDLLWALAAMAVLIAFAGIANTLSLSALERTRESALLRALGLTRGGLRAALVAESVFVALLGASCGLLLGAGSAWLVARVASSAGEPVLFALPWDRLGALLGAAVLAAPLAAAAAARRAARVSPVAGMAER
ncbi:ABC transporter permease [Saccharothrix algeriensis]|uniref:ABC transport system permease protein n=3 Tax=Saccharothrix algeriensis TaxID=173560 RepID=A0ABS2SCM5_9PSEU|nr:FtsX-like permease family protein [Saccharothrix algeriensis]MBM7813709.1 putative ABC transport system permease protein [Saccharothrix algeriensis]